MKKYNCCKKNEYSRKLRFETLEVREMLSVSPLENSTEPIEASTVVVGSEYPTIDISNCLVEVQENADEDYALLVAAWEIRYAEDSQDLWKDSLEDVDSYESSSSVSEIRVLEVRDGVVVAESSDENGSGLRSGGSGGGAYVYLSGGNGYYYEGQTIGISYNGLPDGYTISATVSCNGIAIDSTQSVLSGTSSSGSLSIITIDDYVSGGDKTITVQMSLSGEGQLSSTSFAITVFERPEFISGDDCLTSSTHIDYNSDSYRAYVHSDDEAGTAITVKDSPISSKGGSGLRYSFATPSSYFNINPTTGEITLAVDASVYIANTGLYQCNLTIRAYESRDDAGPYGSSGGGCPDEADITISFSHWNVVRLSTLHTAPVSMNDGCTIAMLAKQIGLTASEFNNWFTFDPDSTAYLFDGSTKLWSQVGVNDVLAAYSYTGLAVPNTMIMAWFGECKELGKAHMKWGNNYSDIVALGFYVDIFDNDSFAKNQKYVAKNTFLNKVWSNSYNKRLHGMYMMGHGSNCFFGGEGSHLHINGPEWDVGYAHYKVLDDNGEVLSVVPVSFDPISGTDRQLLAIISCLRYHMGALIIHGCNSDNTNSRTLVTSTEDNGIFWGWEGTYDPILPWHLHDHDPISKNWGAKFKGSVMLGATQQGYKYDIGGLQETRVLEDQIYTYVLIGVEMNE